MYGAAALLEREEVKKDLAFRLARLGRACAATVNPSQRTHMHPTIFGSVFHAGRCGMQDERHADAEHASRAGPRLPASSLQSSGESFCVGCPDRQLVMSVGGNFA